jgi:4,5-DOPA dioxygenase extradiol
MLPTLFISHGSPMHALDAGAAGEAWATLATHLPRPRAVLVITAHWTTNLPMLSGAATPPMIYDFSGFPDALYRLRYAAPGAPAIAARAQSLLADAHLTTTIDGCRGLDHGTWVPLLTLYPDADIPVVQLSVQPSLAPRHHWQVGRALAALRDEGVLIIGSGHLTHNLRDWSLHHRDQAPLEYTQAFQSWMFDRLGDGDLDALLDYRQRAPHAVRAHPTEEHLLPLFVALGAAGSAWHATRLFDGVEGNALAMDAYEFN